MFSWKLSIPSCFSNFTATSGFYQYGGSFLWSQPLAGGGIFGHSSIPRKNIRSHAWPFPVWWHWSLNRPRGQLGYKCVWMTENPASLLHNVILYTHKKYTTWFVVQRRVLLSLITWLFTMYILYMLISFNNWWWDEQPIILKCE